MNDVSFITVFLFHFEWGWLATKYSYVILVTDKKTKILLCFSYFILLFIVFIVIIHTFPVLSIPDQSLRNWRWIYEEEVEDDEDMS